MATNPLLLQQDPTLQSAMLMQLLSGGALDPRLSSPVAAESFAKGLQMSPADMSMLGKGVASQGLEGQLALSGTGQGPAGDVTRALFAMQQGFDQKQFQPRGMGGGGRRYEDVDPIQPIDPSLLPNMKPSTPILPKPAPGPMTEGLFNEDMGPLAKAMRESRLRGSAIGSQQSQNRMAPDATIEAAQMGSQANIAPGLGGGLSPGVQAMWASNQGAYNSTTPEQALALSLQESFRGSENKSNTELTQSVLSLFARGQALDRQVEALAQQARSQGTLNPDAVGFEGAQKQIEDAVQARAKMREQFKKEYEAFKQRQPEFRAMSTVAASRALEGSVKTKASRLASIIGLKGPAGMDSAEAVMAGMTPSEITDTLRKLESGRSLADLMMAGVA